MCTGNLIHAHQACGGATGNIDGDEKDLVWVDITGIDHLGGQPGIVIRPAHIPEGELVVKTIVIHGDQVEPGCDISQSVQIERKDVQCALDADRGELTIGWYAESFQGFIGVEADDLLGAVGGWIQQEGAVPRHVDQPPARDPVQVGFGWVVRPHQGQLAAVRVHQV